MNLTFKKAIRDIKIYKGRTVLMLLGILIGIAATGAVLSSYAILLREMDRNFMDTNPASMVFTMTNADEKAMSIIKAQYPDTDTEMRKTLQARISRGDGTFGTIYLTAIQDFGKQKIDTFALEKGSYPNVDNRIVLERDDLKILKTLTSGIGESITLQLPGCPEQTVDISGIVHAPGLAPASMENFSYGFVTMSFLHRLGYQGTFDELLLVSYDNRMEQTKMKLLAADVKSLLTENGYDVTRMDVPEPGKHPHADQLSSLLFLLQAFAAISLLAASLIIINLMNFVISRQARQIAIMKAVGGKTRMIAGPYFAYILILSLGAILLSFPAANAISRVYTGFAAGILNFDIGSYTVPLWVIITQIGVGLLIPIASAAQPIFKYCRIKIKDGLNEQIAPVKTKKEYLKRPLFRRNVSTALPVSNLLRKKMRTALAILALVAGGVLFMTAQNITASLDNTVNTNMNTIKWDFEIRLDGQAEKEKIIDAASHVRGLNGIELWGADSGFFKTDGEYTSANYLIKVVPDDTKMADIAGLDAAPNAIVINQAIADEEPWMKLKNEVTLQVGQKETKVFVSHMISELPPYPTIYMSRQTYDRLIGGNTKQIVLAAADTKELSAQRPIMIDTETAFKAAGIEISENMNVFLLRKVFIDHLKVIINFLSAMAMLSVAVGGLSISSTIGINISERKHEIGVLRAIGANTRRVYRIILSEVLLMGIAGWTAGIILSIPTSIFVGNYFGNIFLQTNLNNVLSLSGSLIWLLISIVIALAAGFIPARKAARSSLREMLSYE